MFCSCCPICVFQPSLAPLELHCFLRAAVKAPPEGQRSLHLLCPSNDASQWSASPVPMSKTQCASRSWTPSDTSASQTCVLPTLLSFSRQASPERLIHVRLFAKRSQYHTALKTALRPKLRFTCNHICHYDFSGFLIPHKIYSPVLSALFD